MSIAQSCARLDRGLQVESSILHLGMIVSVVVVVVVVVFSGEN